MTMRVTDSTLSGVCATENEVLPNDSLVVLVTVLQYSPDCTSPAPSSAGSRISLK